LTPLPPREFRPCSRYDAADPKSVPKPSAMSSAAAGDAPRPFSHAPGVSGSNAASDRDPDFGKPAAIAC
jgi:hypothetical protein